MIRDAKDQVFRNSMSIMSSGLQLSWVSCPDSRWHRDVTVRWNSRQMWLFPLSHGSGKEPTSVSKNLDTFHNTFHNVSLNVLFSEFPAAGSCGLCGLATLGHGPCLTLRNVQKASAIPHITRIMATHVFGESFIVLSWSCLQRAYSQFISLDVCFKRF